MVLNRTIDLPSAKKILSRGKFFAIIATCKFEKEALKVFSKKEKMILLENPALENPKKSNELDIKKVRGGFLVQSPGNKEILEKNLKIVTKKKPEKEQIQDFLFAFKVAKVSKSNAIAIVKNQALISSGVGQQDRKRCCELAVLKAGKRAFGAVAASDGFFPFPDGPKILAKAGVKAIAQPGGSIRDQDSIDLCNKYDIAMVFTGIRAFRH